jgi:hypothetical protein
MRLILGSSILLAVGVAVAAPPPTTAERRIPVKVTERYPDGTQSIYNDCLVFNPSGEDPGTLYALGETLVWNFGKLGLDKGRFEAVAGNFCTKDNEAQISPALISSTGLMLYGKFPETKTSNEAPGTPKIEGIWDNGTTLIAEPKTGTCSFN